MKKYLILFVSVAVPLLGQDLKVVPGMEIEFKWDDADTSYHYVVHAASDSQMTQDVVVVLDTAKYAISNGTASALWTVNLLEGNYFLNVKALLKITPPLPKPESSTYWVSSEYDGLLRMRIIDPPRPPTNVRVVF